MSKKQKNVFKKLLIAAMACVLLLSPAIPSYAEAAKAPALNAAEVTIVVGKTFNFNVNNKAKGATYAWSVNNKEVATINKSNGVVTGVGQGSTNIYCQVGVNGTYYRLKAKVTVVKPAVKVTITNPVDTLNVKDYYDLDAKIIPASSGDIVTWTSSNKNIARVDEDGSFAALKPGTVTITAKTVSGRSDSVTIKVLGDGTEEAEEATETEDTEAPKKEDKEEAEKETEEEVKVLKTVYKEDFANSVGKFTARGSARISHTKAGMGAEGGRGYMSVTGRTANWNGATTDITSLVTPGATYRVTAWVRYTSGKDTEVLKVTQQANSLNDETYPDISGQVEVTKGKWTKLSGTMVVSPDTIKCQVYFEAANLIDFFVDNIVIEQLDVELVEKEAEEIIPAKVGDVVYKNDFEGDKVLDTRGNSARTITTKAKHAGKSGLEVTRNYGWDGAGVKFTKANDIQVASLYGKTVHASFYVMYNEGPDEVNFKLNNKMEKADNSDNILSQIAVKKGEWTLIEADCFIAEKATGNMIFVETEGDVALTFYIDDVEMKVVK